MPLCAYANVSYGQTDEHRRRWNFAVRHDTHTQSNLLTGSVLDSHGNAGPTCSQSRWVINYFNLQTAEPAWILVGCLYWVRSADCLWLCHRYLHDGRHEEAERVCRVLEVWESRVCMSHFNSQAHTAPYKVSTRLSCLPYGQVVLRCRSTRAKMYVAQCWPARTLQRNWAVCLPSGNCEVSLFITQTWRLLTVRNVTEQ